MSNDPLPGEVYGAFPISPGGGYNYTVGISGSGLIRALKASDGSYASNVSINVIYI